MEKYSKMYVCFFIFLAFIGCRDDIDGYFERPDYLRGNACEYLEEKGNYTQFLKALELTDYKRPLDGQGLYSVFAPNDEAFKRYLTKKDYASIEAVPLEELKLLVAYHLIEFSYNREDFLAFSSTASSEEPKAGDGTNYKFETLSQLPFENVKDPLDGSIKQVYRQRKFLPILSKTLFETQKSTDLEADYQWFYPDFKLDKNANDVLIAANALVTEAGEPLDNGFMYLIDEVIEYLPTAYEALSQAKGANGESYTLFKEFYDRFTYMEYDKDKTQLYAALGDSLFMHYHYLPPMAGDDLSDIACEWLVHDDNRDNDFEARLKYAANCFVPSNKALESYISTFWAGEYTKDDLPLLQTYYLLKSHVPNRSKIILPSVLRSGINGLYGESWKFEKSNIGVAKLCSNGVLYGIDEVMESVMFSLVMKPFFQKKKYNTMLNMGHKQITFMPLVDPEREYTVLAISDITLEREYGFTVNYEANPTNIDVIGERVAIDKYKLSQADIDNRYNLPGQTEELKVDKSPVRMTGEEMGNFMKSMVILNYIDLDVAAPRKYYATSRPYQYIYTDNKELFNSDGTKLNKIETERIDYAGFGNGRGIVHEVDKRLEIKDQTVAEYLFENRSNPNFKGYYNALLDAELFDFRVGDKAMFDETVHTVDDITSVDLLGMKGDRYMLFVPNGDVWDDNQLPSDSLDLVNFLRYYMVALPRNGLQHYIIPTFDDQGGLEYAETESGTTITKATLNIRKASTSLSLSNEDNDSATTIDPKTGNGFPVSFANDGLVYSIDNMLFPPKKKEPETKALTN